MPEILTSRQAILKHSRMQDNIPNNIIIIRYIMKIVKLMSFFSNKRNGNCMVR